MSDEVRFIDTATVLERMAFTALQPGFQGFTVSPAFRDEAVANKIWDAEKSLLFGSVRCHVVSLQERPALAWWDVGALATYMTKINNN